VGRKEMREGKEGEREERTVREGVRARGRHGGRDGSMELYSFSRTHTHTWRDIFSWKNSVTNEKGIQWIKTERNILHTIRRKKANWIGCILHRNCHITWV
jgi:hypothetical protein